MSTYEWDQQIEYLQKTRDLYYNDDYLEFLVRSVWKITEPVSIIDYGCGYGYMGLKLLPLLPAGSSYTGVDQGKQLLQKAQEIYQQLPYATNFIQADLNESIIEGEYDIALCHAFLLHMNEPKSVLKKMIDAVRDGGRIICFEPHWLANMANFDLEGVEQSKIVQLGVLQKLFELDAQRHGRDGNMGIKLPSYLSALGVQEIECRVSDKVNFLDSERPVTQKEKLFQALSEDGIGAAPKDKDSFVAALVHRGLSIAEAQQQYEAELFFAERFQLNSTLTSAPNMKITFGRVYKAVNS